MDAKRPATERLLDLGLSLLFPPTCVLCGAPGDAGLDLCAGCRADLPLNTPACPRCAKRLPAGLPDLAWYQGRPDQPAERLCSDCRDQPPPYLRCHAAFRYQGSVQRLITDFKFHGRLNLLRLLGQLLARSLDEATVDRPDLILPVPLHPKRLRERGFNQSWELARILHRQLGIAHDNQACRRTRDTAHQVGLAREERLDNLENAFTATRDLANLHIVILDDVVTTGSTVRRVSEALLGAGCARVDVWALARTA